MKLDQTKKIIGFIAELGNVIPKINKDMNYVNIGIALAPLLDDVFTLFSVDVESLKSELKDGFSREEKTEIYEFAKTKFNLSDDLLEEKIERAFELFIELSNFISSFQKEFSK